MNFTVYQDDGLVVVEVDFKVDWLVLCVLVERLAKSRFLNFAVPNEYIVALFITKFTLFLCTCCPIM